MDQLMPEGGHSQGSAANGGTDRPPFIELYCLSSWFCLCVLGGGEACLARRAVGGRVRSLTQQVNSFPCDLKFKPFTHFVQKL